MFGLWMAIENARKRMTIRMLCALAQQQLKQLCRAHRIWINVHSRARSKQIFVPHAQPRVHRSATYTTGLVFFFLVKSFLSLASASVVKSN
jgi:hypothetical protein